MVIPATDNLFWRQASPSTVSLLERVVSPVILAVVDTLNVPLILLGPLNIEPYSQVSVNTRFS